MALIKTLIVLLIALALQPAAAETYLYMAEEDGCSWCAKWDNEIAHIYPKTAEGKTAPLKRFDLFSDKPNVTFKNRVRFTPTFILVQNGVEVDRIEGYPGEDFFWSLLTMMFKRANIPLDPTG
ncbi:thioredoxin family protein [Roseibium denhamense]|uniref:Thioredoxin family protein n=1 Tax=Roseibium denhamense TaxID=76305 RepID=A0ABY1NX46_9HYPH|nr:thioredoxin family protein [Roseibium denhamense]SMP20749.1 hypothetical protein SAMN06265374_2136 [Roseibium denhamense]